MRSVGLAQWEEPSGGGRASAKALRQLPQLVEHSGWGRAEGQTVQAFVVRGGNRSAESSQLLSGALLRPPCLPWLCKTELSLQLLPLISLETWPIAMVAADGPDRGRLLLDSEAWEGLADGNLLYPVGLPEDGGCPGEVTASAMLCLPRATGPRSFPAL